MNDEPGTTKHTARPPTTDEVPAGVTTRPVSVPVEEIRRLQAEIVERREFASILQRRIDLLNRVLECVPFPLYVVNAEDYSIQIANAAARSGRLVAGVTCHALTHGSATPCSPGGQPCPLRSVVRSKEPTVVEHVHLDHDQEPRDVQVHAFPILDGSGEVVQMVEFCVDITAQRSAERERDRLAALRETR